MRKIIDRDYIGWLAILVCGVALLVHCGGCAGESNLQRAAQAESLLTAADNSLVAANQSGLVTQDELKQIAPLESAATAAVLQMEKSAVAGDDNGFTTALAAWRVASNQYLAAVMAAKNKGK